MFNKEIKEYNLSEEELNALQYAVFTTDNGTITLKLFPKEAPNTVANFSHLAKEGFYNGLIFHRVIQGFMAQGGDPTGTGAGGPDWCIKCELENNPHEHKRGAISMAHAGRDTGGSQFFITFVPCPHLDGQHTVFGQIEVKDRDSMKILDQIKQGDKIVSIEIKEKLD